MIYDIIMDIGARRASLSEAKVIFPAIEKYQISHFLGLQSQDNIFISYMRRLCLLFDDSIKNRS